jgi:hypothetical protein
LSLPVDGAPVTRYTQNSQTFVCSFRKSTSSLFFSAQVEESRGFGLLKRLLEFFMLPNVGVAAQFMEQCPPDRFVVVVVICCCCVVFYDIRL